MEIENQLENILKSINTEPKNVALAWCIEDQYKDLDSIMKKFITLVSFDPVKSFNIKDYLENNFIPLEIAFKEADNFYKLSETGLKFAKPIAAFALLWAYQNQKSIYKILGGRSYTRFRIIESLFHDKEIKQSDIKRKLMLSLDILVRNVELLSDFGLIDSTNIDYNLGSWKRYSWINEKDPKKFKCETNIRLAKTVAGACFSRCNFDDKTIFSLKEVSDYNRRDVQSILLNLEDKGFIKVDEIGKLKETLLLLTKEGDKFSKDFVKPIRLFFEKSEGVVLDNFEKSKDDEKYRIEISQAIKYYKNYIRDVYKSSQHRIKILRKTLSVNGRLRPQDIKEILGWRFDMVGSYLQDLYVHGEVTRTREGRAVYYQLK